MSPPADSHQLEQILAAADRTAAIQFLHDLAAQELDAAQIPAPTADALLQLVLRSGARPPSPPSPVAEARPSGPGPAALRLARAIEARHWTATDLAAIEA